MATKLIVDKGLIKGVKLEDGKSIEAQVVVITTGTYMHSYILRGDEKNLGGPDGKNF